MLVARAAVVGAVISSVLAAGPSAIGVPVSAANGLGCTITRPVQGAAALIRQAVIPKYAYVGYQIWQHGMWAGVAYDGMTTYRVISQRPGHQIRVLMTRDLKQGLLGDPDAVGVRDGAVIATVPRPRNEPNHIRTDAYALYPHQTIKLKSRPRWPSTVALAVTDRGTIIGDLTRSGLHASHRVVEWAGPHARPTVVPGLTNLNAQPVADQAGDIAWQRPDGVGMVRLANGTIHVLDIPHPDYLKHGLTSPAAGAGHMIMGASAFDAIAVWNLNRVNRASTTGVIMGRNIADRVNGGAWPYVAGRSGAFIDGAKPSGQHFFTASGRHVTMPAEYSNPLEAIGRHNTVAFTSRRDRLVHIIRCH
jgi:hypothetical protein